MKDNINVAYSICIYIYMENIKTFKYIRRQLNENLRDNFKNKIHSQRVTMNSNEIFCKGVKWIHIAQSNVQWQAVT
jgi:hypothetical protein